MSESSNHQPPLPYAPPPRPGMGLQRSVVVMLVVVALAAFVGLCVVLRAWYEFDAALIQD